MSNNTTRVYRFLPVDMTVKLSIYSFVSIFAAYGILANGLLLYFNRKQTLQKRPSPNRPFSRKKVTCLFVQSLACANLLSCLISLPLAVLINFYPIIDSDLKCKALRFCNMFFPIFNQNIVFVIGIERYLAVFYTFKVPSVRQVKCLLTGACFFCVVQSIVPAMTFKLNHHDVDSNTFTRTCSLDNTNTAFKTIFNGFNFLNYIVRGIILIVTSIRILCRLQQRRRRLNAESKDLRRRTMCKYDGTVSFIALIFAFTIPMIVYITISSIDSAIGLLSTFQEQYIVRRCGGAIAYSNAALAPTVLLLTMKDLRTMLINLFTCRPSKRTARMCLNNHSLRGRKNVVVGPSTSSTDQPILELTSIQVII